MRQDYPETTEAIGRYLGQERSSQEAETVREPDGPWRVVLDDRHRKVVHLWTMGYSVERIGREPDISISGRRVRNLLGELRDQYGPDVVPYRREPKRG